MAVHGLAARSSEPAPVQPDAPCPICLQVESGGTVDFMAAARAQLATQATRGAASESSRLAEGLAPAREPSHRTADPQNKRPPERSAPDTKTPLQPAVRDPSAQGGLAPAAALTTGAAPGSEAQRPLVQPAAAPFVDPRSMPPAPPVRSAQPATEMPLGRDGVLARAATPDSRPLSPEHRELPSRAGSQPLEHHGGARGALPFAGTLPRDTRIVAQASLVGQGRAVPLAIGARVDGLPTRINGAQPQSAAGRVLLGATGNKNALVTGNRTPLTAQAAAQTRLGGRALIGQTATTDRVAGRTPSSLTMGFVPAAGKQPLSAELAREAAKIAPWEPRQAAAAPLVPRSSALGWYGLALAQRLGLSPAQILELLAELEDEREAEEAAELARVEAVEDGETGDGDQAGAESQSNDSGDDVGESA